jgi:hypothetical protein
MMKKALMVTTLVCAAVGANPFADTPSDLETKPDGGGVVITKYTGQGGTVAIPATIDGKAVTGIGEWAFYECSDLVSVTIPEGVTAIGKWAFAGCSRLASVTIPKGVASIAIPASVVSIGEGAFGFCRSLPPEVRSDIEGRFGGKVF